MKRNLTEVVNYERCKKRTEKSKYFTEEFFQKYPTKYRELLEKYGYVAFLEGVVFRVDKKYVTEEYVLCVGGEIGKDDRIHPYSLEITNDSIEENYNEIIDFIEEIDEEARIYEERIKKYEKYLQENKSLDKEILDEEERNDLKDSIEKYENKILELQNILLASPLNVGNYIPLAAYDYGMLLFDKVTGGIDWFSQYDYVGTFEIAGSFDEFIDNLYVKDDKGKNYQNLIQAREVRKKIEEAVEAEDEE